MKHFISMIVMVFVISSKAQITLENSYPATSSSQLMQVVELVKSGYKYQTLDYTNKNLKLYNLNHSLFKSINLPTPAGFFLNSAIVSDSLFNTDNLVEVAYTYYGYNYTVTPLTYTTETKIIDENVSNIFTLPQGTSPSIYYTGSANGYKMIINVDSVNKTALKQTNVYSLVGGLPIHLQTHAGSNPTGLITTNNSELLTSAAPNPSSNRTTIGYQFPKGESSGIIVIYNINGKELKQYVVDNTFNTLELDNSDLSSGTYFYQVSTSSGKSSAKKMLVIK